MTRRTLFLGLTLILSLGVITARSQAQAPSDWQRLAQAGISAETLAVIAQEKILETCAFTVDEIITLKQQSRMSDKDLQALLRQRSFMQHRDPVRLGDDIHAIQQLTVQDIQKLKEAGVSDGIIQTIIMAQSPTASEADRDKAWEMLKGMGIWVDDRTEP